MREIVDEAVGKDPTLAEKVAEGGASFMSSWFTAHGSVQKTYKSVDAPVSVNDAVRLVQYLGEKFAEVPVFVIDEFDQITDPKVQEEFTNFIKQVADKHAAARFIFCGIGESVDAIMAAHGSADRYFHAVELSQLAWEARYEIVEFAAEKLGIEIDRDTVIRIAMISDGFPHYVHFISEKLFWIVFEEANGGKVSPVLFERAMAEAAGAMDLKLRGPYERATQKYSDDYEAILWAVADGHQLRRPSKEIYTSYLRVMKELKKVPLDRQKFNNRINRLKLPAHDCILTASRAGWYEFSEKMIRGYVRLKAQQAGVSLETDHPAARKGVTSQ